MDNRQNDGKKNGDRIRSGIDRRRSRGERPRQLHKKGGRDTRFPTEDPVFEMESAQSAADASASPAGAGEKAGATDARSRSARDKGKQRGKKKRKELDTGFAHEARGISHERRRRKQNLRDLLKVLSVVFAILFIIAAISLFRRFTIVKTISVTGSKQYGSEQLVSLSGLSTGKSFFSYKQAELSAAVDSVYGVRTKSVRKVFPNRIEIAVEDVAARAAIMGVNGRCTIISADGYVLSVGSEKPEGLLEVRGLSGFSFAPGTYINRTERSIRTVGAIELIAAIDASDIAEKALYIDLSGSAYTVLGLENNYRVVLGAVTTASECLYAAGEAYRRFLPVYPEGGTINVFNGSSIVDFTPNKR
ncbi:MAG: FtsQ-type POTRA domain-containing protein [Clostridia bacterium]|nr:FtsQ-type POTRA domain-containing protein [Clostridia bacterium]